MRTPARAALLLATTSALACGCASMSNRQPATPAVTREPSHPAVVIQGIDGTTMAGELLNGSITLDSGQGELTLLTDHIHSVTLAADADKLDSDSIKVSGKVRETRFFLKNEHGVFTLSKDRLRRIDFVNSSPKAPPALAGGNGGTTPVRAATASPASR